MMNRKEPTYGGIGGHSSRGKIPPSLLSTGSNRNESNQPNKQRENSVSNRSHAANDPEIKKETGVQPKNLSDPDSESSFMADSTTFLTQKYQGKSFTQHREKKQSVTTSEDSEEGGETEDSDDYSKPGPSGPSNRSGSLNDLSQVEVNRLRNLGLTNVHEGHQASAFSLKNQLSPYNSCGLTGLRNIGNTCFMNSILQCLSNTMPLLDYVLIQKGYLQDLNTTNSTMQGTLMKAFAKLIQDIWSESKPHDVDTYNLKSQIQKFNTIFRGARQHDSQELLRFLLEGLHSDVNRVTQKPKLGRVLEIKSSLPENEQSQIAWNHYHKFDDSKIADIFVGQLKSTLTCLTCGYRSVTFDPFWDLSLSIPSVAGRGFTSSNAVKLEQCLQLFTQEEILDGNEKPNCERCKARRKCSKKFSIQKFPEVLVIHLKRFTMDDRGKLRTSVKFPVNGLDMSPYGETNNVSYNLYGVSNHFGTAFSGHYIAYCRHAFNGDWNCYDDARVSPISEETLNTVEGYVLFYEMSLASKSLLDFPSTS